MITQKINIWLILFLFSKISLKFLEPHPFELLGPSFASVVDFQPLDNVTNFHINMSLVNDGLEINSLERLKGILKGAVKPQKSLAMVYAGHQFGQKVSQLGDGRGLLIGKLDDLNLDIHIKGAGQTPYSRFGDGRAVSRSVIREYLAGEAMHALNIPSSRALMMAFSNETVIRETPEKGSQLLRVSKTHIRFGHFEYFNSLQEKKELRELLDWCIETYFHEFFLEKDKYLLFFKEVVRRTALMIADWQSIGFCHGVMNTDNMSILGETFDYGPYGFMEIYDPKHICNRTDIHGRYSYQNQPLIGLWNCSVLAKNLEAFIEPLQLEDALKEYEIHFQRKLLDNLSKKLGLFERDDRDAFLIQDLLNFMEKNKLDFTQSFLNIEKVLRNEDSFLDDSWIEKFNLRHQKESVDLENRILLSKNNNPKFVLRNFHIQTVIEEINNGEFDGLYAMEEMLREPYEYLESSYEFYKPSMAEFNNLALSCSS